MIKSTFTYLEFDRFKDILSQFASSKLGGERVKQVSVYSNADDLAIELEKTTEGVKFIHARGEIGFSEIEDPASIFQRLKVDEVILEPLEILTLTRLIELGLEIRHQFDPRIRPQSQNEFPQLFTLAGSISNFRTVKEKINGSILPSGEIADSASPDLKRIRNTIRVLNAKIQKTLEGYLQRQDAEKIVQDYYITIRNNRFVIPIKVEQKKSVGGVIHGVSSSGATIFLEPFECIELNNELVRLQDEEKEEIQRILADFTRHLRLEFSNLLKLTEIVTEFDFILAKAKFSVKFNCCRPQINTTGVLALDNARHPLLEETLKSRGQAIVPLSIRLEPQRNALIISGPNTGGKTVALKTAGLLALIALTGLHVPAEAAQIPVLKQVLADIGDNQSITESLSTFSSHVLNISDMINELTLPALILLDEVGTGTNPDDEAALGIAIVDYFRVRGALVIATTHHNSIKAYAINTTGVLSAAMEFNERSMKPTYRLVPGLAGNSSGIEIASRLGLPPEIIKLAKTLIGTKDVEAEKYLSRIKEKLLELEEQILSLKTKEADLEAEAARIKQLHARRENERQRALENKLNQLVASFSADAATVLREIEDEAVRLKLNKQISRKAIKLKSNIQRAHDVTLKSPEQKYPTTKPTVGDEVYVKGLSLSGVVTRVYDDLLEIDINGKTLRENLAGVELTAPNASRAKKISLPEGVTIELEDNDRIESELNVIGCTVDEALAKADKFLDRAILMSLEKVRIIHGHGTGKLRRAIAEFLGRHADVASYDQSESHGGVTSITLKCV